MTWLLAVALVAALAIVVGYCQRGYATDDKIDTLIKPVDQRFVGSDEALQARTLLKRKAADTIRRRAAKVESGSTVADVLRMVRK